MSSLSRGIYSNAAIMTLVNLAFRTLINALEGPRKTFAVYAPHPVVATLRTFCESMQFVHSRRREFYSIWLWRPRLRKSATEWTRHSIGSPLRDGGVYAARQDPLTILE